MDNHVGLVCCAVCGEPKGVALCTEFKKVNGKLEPKQSLPEKFADGPELCDKCLQKMKDDNTFVMYEVDGEEGKPNPKFTGRWAVLNFECLSKEAPFYDFVDKNRFILADLEQFNRITSKEED
jgi:hypothetical protein